MKLSQFKYPIPKSLIAKVPKKPKDSSKMMVLNRGTQTIETKKFKDFVNYLSEGDVLVLNDTKVFPARMYGTKEKTRAKIEVFLLRQLNEEENIWDVVVDPARKVRIGNRIFFTKNLYCEVIDNTTSRGRIVRFNIKDDFRKYIDKLGKMPLPFYVKREATDKDKTDYQSVFAKNIGSVAGPSAGFHFTTDVLNKLKKKKVKIVYLTMHLGLGTYRPVEVEDLSKHRMDSEYYEIPKETAETINKAIASKKKIAAVGSNVVRALESSVITGKQVRQSKGWTDKFIHPPQTVRVVDILLENFHLPQSTMLMLVCAFGERDFVMKGYKKAIKEKYRFYDFGDAMLII
ncbi:MAG: tRNA preQ1(34) S-adenosylmethionine ribosyltransferase-isomerase QueA [Ignavibacteriaceae bacterium]|jgi:S-adenosylmethionine--tRNA ribosyltransferase-isomerase|nr:MAG: tRNA preQ1(34) S-adenosylmethionine ribosyltransferase-isomerase QueA [Chlorobiota bacterium]KXK04127.1 MAG: S-adenosylmethionine/tRNA-ribosyltransferase- isomerase [Chlorobi bacterium OLB4]MBV6397888.1 S-adenosylmethionine:tRNA ribosyltransferase-isomerase [Ignavibacteria bacterium]MCC6886835.1 tRNA preQ1(34) S-adenosylmethionine ribosyltransferase-isomerase QueA [Ignavibacteriales bacterium]MCE7953959.1 tRNA preQ1(34) S-adenosylmethionine ribosyltransferase-isomerase QueA [Chlorobi ba